MRKCRITRFIILTFLLTAIAFAAGCGEKNVAPLDPATIKQDIIGKVWKCESLYSRPVHEDSRLTLEFMEDGTIRGSGGCNNFGGKYELTADSIKIGPLHSTKKACSPATDEQEFSYLGFLQLAQKLEVDDDELFLISNQSDEPMRFIVEGSGSLLW